MLSVFFLVQAVCLFVPRERMDVIVGLTTAVQQDGDERLDFGAHQRELTIRYFAGWRSQPAQLQYPKTPPSREEGFCVVAYGLDRPNGYLPPYAVVVSPPPVTGVKG